MRTTADARLRVVAWVRDPSPPTGDPRRAVLSRLRELEQAGTVDDVSVRVWSKYVPVSPDADSPARERIDEFRDWARRTGHSLEPAFEHCERSTMVSGGTAAAIRVPLQCLAVYADDCLVGVFPCTTGDETRTVDDCLGRLETGTLAPSAALD